ncbi:MAG: hypothetical protein JNL60_01935 [Bacteroidia bacterium]|nr:hypothetical protein [Bacteroidia bacterium]
MTEQKSNNDSNQTFEGYKKYWSELRKKLQQEKPEIFGAAKEGVEWLSRIIEITQGSTIVNTPQVLIHEFSRIYSRTIRRFYAIEHVSVNLHTDILLDELRSITEMFFKVFYLLRISDPELFAIDARNLSAISRLKAGDRLYDLGKLIRPEGTPEIERFNKIKEELYLKYKGRKPKFYGDRSVAEIAEGASLINIYYYAYNLLSSNAHNEPMSELQSLQLYENESAYISVVPDGDSIDMFAQHISLFNQTAVLTSMAALSGFADFDKKLAKQLLIDFSNRYEGYGWEKEIETIYEKSKIL